MSPSSDLQLAFLESLTRAFREHRQGKSARGLEWTLDETMGRLHADTVGMCTTQFSDCGHHLVSFVTGIVGHGFQGGNPPRSFLDKLILKGVDINVPDQAGRRPLVQAMVRHSEFLKLELLAFALEQPLDVLSVDSDRNSVFSVRYADPQVRQALHSKAREQWLEGSVNQRRAWLDGLASKLEDSHEPFLAELRHTLMDQSLDSPRAGVKPRRF